MYFFAIASDQFKLANNKIHLDNGHRTKVEPRNFYRKIFSELLVGRWRLHNKRKKKTTEHFSEPQSQLSYLLHEKWFAFMFPILYIYIYTYIKIEFFTDCLGWMSIFFFTLKRGENMLTTCL